MLEDSAAVNPIPEPTEAIRPRAPKPTLRQWALHGLFFVVTAFTTTLTGIFWAGSPALDASTSPPPAATSDSLLLLPWYYIKGIVWFAAQAFTHPSILMPGVLYSASLLAILAAHESGHYLFCRYYGVDATLPFFIPQPPLLLPGTFGAFIRMKSPVPSRRALFDIGLAGPLAGFLVIVPVALVGVLTVQKGSLPTGDGSTIIFHDPLLFRLIAHFAGINLDESVINPFYLAAWVGLLVTSLNLMPVGQLDGGHGTFAVFGERTHWWIARVAFVSVVALTVLGYIWYRIPSGILYAVLLAIMLRVRHPRPEHMEPLGTARVVIGIVTIIVFLLCFLPFPITMG